MYMYTLLESCVIQGVGGANAQAILITIKFFCKPLKLGKTVFVCYLIIIVNLYSLFQNVVPLFLIYWFYLLIPVLLLQ